MQIALTQKLATGSGKTLSPAQENVHPLFDWTANWVKVWANSRTEDMLIVLNNSSEMFSFFTKVFLSLSQQASILFFISL